MQNTIYMLESCVIQKSLKSTKRNAFFIFKQFRMAHSECKDDQFFCATARRMDWPHKQHTVSWTRTIYHVAILFHMQSMNKSRRFVLRLFFYTQVPKWVSNLPTFNEPQSHNFCFGNLNKRSSTWGSSWIFNGHENSILETQRFWFTSWRK